MLTMNGLRLAKILIRRRVRPSYFDNWYIHCPKCGSLLIRRLGPEGPRSSVGVGAEDARGDGLVVGEATPHPFPLPQGEREVLIRPLP